MNQPIDPAIQGELDLIQKFTTPGTENLDEALKVADRLCAASPEYANAFIIRSILWAQKGDRQEAALDLEHALSILPRTAEDIQQAACLLIESGNLTVARDLLCELLENEPENAHALGLRGIVWNNLKAHDRAVHDLGAALKKGGDDATLLQHRGIAWNELGHYSFTCSNYRRAIADCSKAMELEPKNADLWRLRGVSWFQIARRAWFGTKNHLQSAIDDYSEAIRLNPNDIDAWQFRALAHWFRLDLDDVIADCTEVLQRNPKHLEALQLRKQAYRRLKRNFEADEDDQAIGRILKSADQHCGSHHCGCCH